MKHRCLAVFIVFVLFFTIYGFITFGVFRAISTARFLNQAFASSNFYNNINEFANSLAAGSENQGIQSKIFIKLLGELIEPADLKAQIERNSTVFIGYLKNEKSTLDVSFDLKKIKSSIKLESGIILPPIITDEIKNLPTCEGGQPTTEKIDCIPANTSQVDFANQLMKNYNPDDLLKMLPDQFVLADYVKNPAQTFYGPRLFYTIIKIGFYLDLILSLIFIFFLILLGKNETASVFRWTGVALMIPGGVSLIEFFLSKPLSSIATQQIYAGLKHESIKFISPVVDAVTSGSTHITLIYSGTVFFLGLILIIISFIVPHTDTPVPLPQPPKPSTGGLTEAK